MSDLRQGRYSTDELRAIIERAIDLQDQGSAGGSILHESPLNRPANEDGMTLDSVKEVAAEVGLEAEFVESAVKSLEHEARHASAGLPLLGSPIRYAASATFPRQATDGIRSELIDSLRRDSGHEGHVREVLDSVEWSTVGRMTKTTVAIGAGEAATEVQVRVDASGLAATTGLGSIGGGLLAGLAVVAVVDPASAFGTVPIIAAGGMLGAGVARAAWNRISRSLQDRAERLRDELGRRLMR